MNTTSSIADLNRMAQDVADSMTKVATAIAQLGVEGDADAQMALIKAENDKVLDRIRQIYGLPGATP